LTSAIFPDIRTIDPSKKNIYKSRKDQAKARLTDYENNLLSKPVNIKSHSFLDYKHNSKLDSSNILPLEISNNHHRIV
ncbi:12554_t:CDS:1, partial [Acaulospora morrowiae]